jgi:hypothetical protein
MPSQGPKKAVSEAIAHLLKIQLGIHSTEDSSSKRPVARIVRLYKLRSLASAMALSQAVGQRRCQSPKVDGGRLQKAAQGASLARKKSSLAPPLYQQLENFTEVCLWLQALCIDGYI